MHRIITAGVIFLNGFLYGYSNSILTCLEFGTGRVAWTAASGGTKGGPAISSPTSASNSGKYDRRPAIHGMGKPTGAGAYG